MRSEPFQPNGSAIIPSVARISESFLQKGKDLKAQLELDPRFKNKDLTQYVTFPIVTEVKIRDWNDQVLTARIESIIVDYDGNEIIPDPPITRNFKHEGGFCFVSASMI